MSFTDRSPPPVHSVPARSDTMFEKIRMNDMTTPKTEAKVPGPTPDYRQDGF